MKRVRLQRNRGMGRGSFYLELVPGPYAVSLYFEPVNGWRHARLAFWRRPHAVWVGAFLLLWKRWKR